MSASRAPPRAPSTRRQGFFLHSTERASTYQCTGGSPLTVPVCVCISIKRQREDRRLFLEQSILDRPTAAVSCSLGFFKVRAIPIRSPSPIFNRSSGGAAGGAAATNFRSDVFHYPVRDASTRCARSGRVQWASLLKEAGRVYDSTKGIAMTQYDSPYPRKSLFAWGTLCLVLFTPHLTH